MNAKTELARRICETFPGGTPITAEAVTAILKDYIIIKDSDEQRSDLNRRIKYYLGAKRIDGLSERTLKNYKYNLEMFAERMNKSAAKIAAISGTLRRTGILPKPVCKRISTHCGRFSGGFTLRNALRRIPWQR